MKRANFGSKLEQWKAVHENGWSVATFQRRDVPTSRHPHVATSPCRDVPTSRCWVNHYKSQQAVTSRRLNVVTSQRRDVSTSRRCNVATSQCRDVATSRRQREICPPSLKSNRGSEFKASGDVRTRARKSRAAATLISKKSPGFVLFPIFEQ